ncbi:MAG: hypothetical protein CM15mV51_0490 [uncultured marine virus]|nr:MAG: hypothetical protein CM15mV51_0490 [uncultured marine virus]
MQGLGTSNPYQGATTGSGTAIKPLFDIGYQSSSSADSRMLFLLDQSTDLLTAPINNEIVDLVTMSERGCDNQYPYTPEQAQVHRIQFCGSEGNEFVNWASIPGAPSNPQVGDVYYSTLETYS